MTHGRKHTLRWVSPGWLLALVLLVTACGGGGGEGAAAGSAVQGDGEALVIDGEEIADAELFAAAREEGPVVFYGTYAPAVTEQAIEVFTEETGIEIQHDRLQSPAMFERVLSELSAGQLGADIVDFTDVGIAADAAAEGVWQPHEIPNLDEIPEEYVHEDGTYYTTATPLFGIAWNTELIEGEPPATWEDLLDPRWEGQIGTTNIASNTNWTTHLMLHELFGEEYWESLAGQSPRLYDSIVPLTEGLVRGEVTVAITHLGTVVPQAEEGAPLGMVLPTEGVPAPPHFSGVAVDAPNPNAAKVFMNWRMSRHGSQVWSDASGEYGAHPDIEVGERAGIQIPNPSEAELFIPDLEAMTTQREELGPVWSSYFEG